MIYKIKKDELVEVFHDPSFSELEIENLLIPQRELEPFYQGIFQEDLLFVANQRTLKNKFKAEQSSTRLDILAIDKQGNGVVIEIKKNLGALGMETQALFYLSSVAPYIGKDFLELGLGKPPTEDQIKDVESFINGPIDLLNKKSRIILLATDYNTAVFSLGNWLNQASCSFKAVVYHVAEINGEKLIQFSTRFEANSNDRFGLDGLKHKNLKLQKRNPSIFWHNIGYAQDDWWNYLIKTGEITASYDNLPNIESKGSQIMSQYVPEDVVFAFASGFGVVGYGRTTKSPGYKYKDHGIEKYKSTHSHTHSIQWIKTVSLDRAVPVSYLKKIGLNHPTQTKQEIRLNKKATDLLIKALSDASDSKKAA